VLPLLQHGGNVPGLIDNLLAKVGPTRSEHLVAYRFAVDMEFIGSESGGVETRRHNGLRDAEGMPQRGHSGRRHRTAKAICSTESIAWRRKGDGRRPGIVIKILWLPCTLRVEAGLPLRCSGFPDMHTAVGAFNIKRRAHRSLGVPVALEVC